MSNVNDRIRRNGFDGYVLIPQPMPTAETDNHVFIDQYNQLRLGQDGDYTIVPNVDNPETGNVIVYDSATKRWVSKPLAEAKIASGSFEASDWVAGDTVSTLAIEHNLGSEEFNISVFDTTSGIPTQTTVSVQAVSLNEIDFTIANGSVFSGKYYIIFMSTTGSVGTVGPQGPRGPVGPQGPTIWSGLTGTPTTLEGYGITDAVLASEVGAASGVASLDSTGHIPTAELPEAVLGGLNYKGVWNAYTNTPALASGVGNKGYFYKVDVAGSTNIDGITQWNIGDSITFNGTTWDKIDGVASEVTSVAGRTGNVVLSVADVSNAASVNSPMFFGTPTAPTAAVGTDTTVLATAEFVINQIEASTSQFGSVKSVAGRIGNVTLAVADVSGAAPSASPTFTGTTTVTGPLVPSAAGQTIGSATLPFEAIYVNEAHLATNTLYLDGTPVLSTSNATIMVSADTNQSIAVQTTGTGQTQIISQDGVQVSTSGMNANVLIEATGNGGSAIVSGNLEVQLNAPNVNVNGAFTVTGATTFTGNVTFNGSNTTVNTQTVEVTDNLLLLNNGEVGKGVTSGVSGLRIDRGQDVDQRIIWSESASAWLAGPLSSEVALATQPWVTAQTAQYATLSSPTFTGNPTAPTQSTSDSSTKIATTAFVNAQIAASAPVTSVAGKTGAVVLTVADVSGAAPLASPTFTGSVTAPVLVSSVTTGTAPFTVTSTTPVANLSIGGNAATATTALACSGNSATASVASSCSGNAASATGQTFNFTNTNNTPTYLWSTSANGTAYLAATASISVGSAATAVSATTAGTVTTAAQPAITSLGTLTSLSVGLSTTQTNQVTTSSVTAGQALFSVPQATYRSAKFLIQGVDSTGSKFQVTNLVAVHNGSSTVDFTEFGSSQVGGLTGAFTVTANGTNMILSVTPSTTNSTVFKITAVLTAI